MSNPYIKGAIHCAGNGCEHVRRESNHWFLVGEIEDAMTGDQAFYCRPLNMHFPIEDSEKPACGAACAQKLFEQFLSK